MKPPARKPKIKVIIWLAGTLFAVGCALWLAFKIVYNREVALLTAPPATVLLHSKLRYNKVVVLSLDKPKAFTSLTLSVA